MKLYLKQKVFSWTDRFTVRDEGGADRYSVQGQFFSIGKKLHIYDAAGREIAMIRQRVLSLMSHYYIDIGGRTVCEIRKKLTFLRPSYTLIGLPWDMQGEFWAHEFTLSEGAREIMSLRKRWFTWGDSYELDIHDPAHELVCLCVTLAVDAAMESQHTAAASAGS